MPRHRTIYDKSIRETPDFKPLYDRWQKIKKEGLHPDFAEFPKFFKWSIKHGFVPGAHLIRLDNSKPYGPKNCKWNVACHKDQGHIYGDEQREWIKKWNETVNRIRKHYGMEPVEVEHG